MAIELLNFFLIFAPAYIKVLIMFPNGMTHPQVSQVWPNLFLSLAILGVLILAGFLLAKYVFFKNITQQHEH